MSYLKPSELKLGLFKLILGGGVVLATLAFSSQLSTLTMAFIDLVIFLTFLSIVLPFPKIKDK